MWYCNEGLLVRQFFDQDICLCPFSYYGERCEFQRRRVSVVFQLDSAEKYIYPVSAIKLIVYLMGTDNERTTIIIDSHQMVIVPEQRRLNSKHATYLRYLVPLL